MFHYLFLEGLLCEYKVLYSSILYSKEAFNDVAYLNLYFSDTKSFVTASGHRESSILLEQIIARIESILAWFQEQKMFFFRGSSILVSYNAEYFQQDSVSSEGNAANSGGLNKDPSKGQDEQLQVTNSSSDSEIGAGSNQEKASPLRVRVKMIDFAHVLKSGGHKDELYLVGLENFLAFLKECRQVVGT